jgi:hypothetical protein
MGYKIIWAGEQNQQRQQMYLYGLGSKAADDLGLGFGFKSFRQWVASSGPGIKINIGSR